MSDELVVIVPTRGRPANAAELAHAFRDTETEATLVFALDRDDRERDRYLDLVGGLVGVTVLTQRTSSMVQALNMAAGLVLADASRDTLWPTRPFAIGFMGDDHRPRTLHWDRAYLAELRRLGTGLVYGDDLHQRQRLPTQVAMTADIVRALGFMAPPTLRHLYVDNYWRQLGKTLGRLTYLGRVVVEHMHPSPGKAAWDDGYERVGSRAMWDHDSQEFERHMRHEFGRDLDRVRELLP